MPSLLSLEAVQSQATEQQQQSLRAADDRFTSLWGELFTAGAPTPTSLGELLLINGFIDQPNPSYPALCLQDTTHSWSSDDQATNSCMPLLQQWYIPPVPRGTPVPGGGRLIRTTCGLWDLAHTCHLCLVGTESTPGGAQARNL